MIEAEKMKDKSQHSPVSKAQPVDSSIYTPGWTNRTGAHDLFESKTLMNQIIYPDWSLMGRGGLERVIEYLWRSGPRAAVPQAAVHSKLPIWEVLSRHDRRRRRRTT